MNAKRVVANIMVATACSVSLLSLSCSGFSAKSAENATEIGDSIQASETDKNEHRVEKSQDPNSLEFWTSDKVFYANPYLVRTLNHMYGYKINAEYNETSFIDNIYRMNGFRNQLCDYYRETRPDAKSDLTEYAMADSVIAEARRLYALSDDESTMGVVVDTGVEGCFLMFEQYNEYSKLMSICKAQKQKDIITAEFQAWMQLANLFTELYCDCVDLNFWGGSICGPILGYGVNEIWKAHLELYRSEYSLLNDTESASPVLHGTFVEPARKLLIECCKRALKEYNNYEYYKDDSNYKEPYKKTLKSAKSLLPKLDKAVDNWIAARKQWGDESARDWDRPTYQQNTAAVLISLACLISSIK